MNSILSKLLRFRMVAFCLVTGIWLSFLPAEAWAQPNLIVDNAVHNVFYNGSFQDFTVPATAGKIILTVKGGDGGRARAVYDDGAFVEHDCISNGGQGATITATFNVGNGAGQIPPGSIIRFIAGGAGQSGFSITGAGGTFTTGGGGGATGILFKAPSASSFTPLTIAGAGGGAYQGVAFIGCVDSEPGLGGNTGSSGDTGSGEFNPGGGGSGGFGGGGQGGGLAGGGGGAFFSDGGGVICVGLTFPLGIFANIAGEGHQATSTGSVSGQGEGCGSFGTWHDGGFGYGSGGAGNDVGGGGGGYSGGGAGGSTGAGGGGGSYVNPIAISSSGSNGGSTGSPNHGVASYQAIPVPSNDLCAGAITLTCGGSSSGSTEFATADDAPSNGCGLDNEEGVWFKFIGTGDVMTLTSNGSNFDTQIHIYAGSCSALTCVGSDDDSGSNFNSLFSFCTVLNTTYYVYLDGYLGDIGNYTISLSCNFIAPTISCPASFSKNTDPGQCSAVTTYSVTANDNCEGYALIKTGGPASGAIFPTGPTLVTWKVTDGAGATATCSFTVTVTDNQAPVISGCPGNKVQSNYPGLCSSTVGWTAPSAVDNCGVTSFTSTHSPGASFPVGTTNVTYTAKDAAMNTSVCSFMVTVNDNEIPSISCPGNMVLSNSPGICGAVVTYSVNYNDNCPGANLSQTLGQASGTIFPIGTTTNKFTVTDANFLTSSCSFTITVSDTEKPVINNCPAGNFSVNNTPGLCTAPVSWTPLTADDNCSIISFTILPLGGNPGYGGGTFPVGTTNVIFTATDQANNQSTCTFSVTVTDVQNPVISNCPGPIVKANDPGVCGANVSWTAPTASDNCSANLVSSHNPGAFFPKGTTNVNYTATDPTGNSASCSFTVTVNDTEKPVISGCPASASYCWENFSFGNLSVPTATDNCGVTGQTGPTFNPNNSFNPGTTTTVSYTFSDAANNTSVCSFTIVIFPRPLPNITTSLVPFGCQGLGVLTANVSNGNVLPPPLTYNWSSGLGTSKSVIITSNGSYTVTVTDGNGCTNTASITTNINLYTTLSNYTMISTKEVELKESDVNGGVGVTDPSKKAKIKNNSAVIGFVQAADIDLNSSTINGGSAYPYPNNPPYGAANVALPVFQFNTSTTNSSPDLTVNNGQTVTINGPNKVFRTIEVKEGGTLIVGAGIGTLFVRDIKTKDGASILFAGNTEVRVQKKVDLYKNNIVGPAGPYSVTFWIEDDLTVKEGSSFTANVYAMKKIESKGKSDSQNSMAGIFISEYKIDSDWANWNPNPNCGLPLNPPAQGLVINDQIGLVAKAEQELVHLEWVTNTGYKTTHFEVERSENGVDFQPVLEAENQSSGKLPKLYKDVDKTPAYGANFYRVKVYFQDGTFAYSEVRRVNFLMETGELNLFPNPASETISFYREAYVGKQAVVSIANNQGIIVFEKTFDALPDGPVMIETGGLQDGLYRFFIKAEGKRMVSKNFVKMK